MRVLVELNVVEQRYQAVVEVLSSGATVTDVARRNGVARQPVHVGLRIPAATPTTMHWGGHGGSFVTMDPANAISFAYAQNQLLTANGPLGDARRSELWRRLGEVTRLLV